MHQRRIFFLSSRFPWWGWILLLPLAVLGLFLGAVFFLVFIAFVFTAGLVMWIRWKWMLYKMGGGKGGAIVRRDVHQNVHQNAHRDVHRDVHHHRRDDVYDIRPLDDSDDGPKR